MKKRILFVLEAFDKGGVEKVTLDIVNNLNKEKYDITIKVIWYGGICQSKVKDYIKVEPFFKKYRKGIMRYFIYCPRKILYKTYIREKYDVEIAVGDGIPSRIVSGSNNKFSKKISWIHMDVLKRGSILKEFNNIKSAQKIYKCFDKIICVSNDCKKNFEKKFGIKDKLSVIYNPIPVEKVLKLSKEKINDVKFNSKEFNIISVGRLDDSKGYDRLIDAHIKLLKEGIKHNLYIIGDGVRRENLENIIKENNLLNSVKLLGFKDNPYKYMKKSDLFVVSSRDEAFSLVLAEAIILGIPIISTKCSGPIELLDNGKYGLLVENSNEGIYKGLKLMMTNKEIYNKYKEIVTQRRNFFDFNNQIHEFKKILS